MISWVCRAGRGLVEQDCSVVPSSSNPKLYMYFLSRTNPRPYTLNLIYIYRYAHAYNPLFPTKPKLSPSTSNGSQAHCFTADSCGADGICRGVRLSCGRRCSSGLLGLVGNKQYRYVYIYMVHSSGSRDYRVGVYG